MKPPKPHGRAAADNPPNRYQALEIQAFDDGWEHGLSDRLATRIGTDHSRKAISYNDSPDIPFDRSINPYRGCEHGCIYCYARPSHAWLDLSPGLDFESRLFARPDLPALLRRELASPAYRVKPLALGTVTDAYQPIEREYRITRQVLEILAETAHPVMIVSKSAMPERDIDLLAQMAVEGLVEVAISLTTLQPGLARTLEPRAAAPHRRLQTIERLSTAGIPVRVMLAPIIPILNEAEIEQLLQAARTAGASAAEYVMVRLPLEVAPLFRDWLQQHFPDMAAHVMRHIQEIRGGRDNDSSFGRRMRGSGPYADMIAQRFRLASRRLGFRAAQPLRCDLFRPPVDHERVQLDLFGH